MTSYKSIFSLFGLTVITSALLISVLHTLNAGAVSGNEFNSGRIIDDAVFYDSNSMSATQIQNFLNSKNPNCDINGTQPASDWGYPNITHAQLAEYKRNGTNGFSQDTGFHAPPYRCLTVYRQDTPQMEAASGYCNALSAGSRSTAQIIKDVSIACGINPQVLIILLEKEQSLVADTWPLNRQLRNATGFACPDTAPCDPKYEGLFYQIYYAARQFKVYQAHPEWYNYQAGRTQNIYWHPDLSRCGSAPVYIQNQATAALYTYTPYQPNQAALNNLYGLGDGCSSYGNRNFWRIFNDWFGSTLRFTIRSQVQVRYNQLGGVNGSLGMVVDNGFCNSGNTTCWQGFENGMIIYNASTGAWESKGGIRKAWAGLGYQSGVMGYPAGPEVWDGKGWYQEYQNGFIIGTSTKGFWQSSGPLREAWAATGFQSGAMGYPIGPISTTSNSSMSWQQYQNGYIVWNPSTGAWESKGGIRRAWADLGFQNGVMGYPAGRESWDGKGWHQEYQNGVIAGTPKTGFWGVYRQIYSRWSDSGGTQGLMGYPVNNAVYTNTGFGWQEFQNGFIVWDSSTGAWESKGAIRQTWSSLGFQSGKAGLPIGPEMYDSATKIWSQQYQHGTIYYSSAKGGWYESK